MKKVENHWTRALLRAKVSSPLSQNLLDCLPTNLWFMRFCILVIRKRDYSVPCVTSGYCVLYVWFSPWTWLLSSYAYSYQCSAEDWRGNFLHLWNFFFAALSFVVLPLENTSCLIIGSLCTPCSISNRTRASTWILPCVLPLRNSLLGSNLGTILFPFLCCLISIVLKIIVLYILSGS